MASSVTTLLCLSKCIFLTTLSTCRLATLCVISLCISMKRLASCSILSLSMTLQDAQLSPFTLPVQAQTSI
ncbi:hypothetical protein DM01DRAFT_307920, partial [Hesseltinella vesiculosa]